MVQTGETNLESPDKTSRRQWLCLTGAGIGLALGAASCNANEDTEAEKVLKQGDKIDIGEKGKEIVEKAYQLGYEYEKKYGGCAQCALAALQDAIPFVAVDKDVFRAASCLDGGATPTGVQNCGAFTGSGIAIGYLCGRTREAEFKGSTEVSHDVIRKVYEHFKEDYGSVLCKDVKEKMNADCPEVVGKAARWAAEAILSEFTNYGS